ncbi:hypothetical protein G6F35_018942 [Rhizopus arrhizus]|nr:hypothetical protein G6F23_015413 [Rhizopus arrhizus]KAG1165153.1 hypothetical protein G6F35_018942 [Rhizopus arrhizus]KAG1386434.1 hypothetical protein G6F59_016862 [Rhizopus arrhizus]KAG1387103.1 hypothetical protein G6F58_013705 [Rhizopus delemar]
MLRRPKPSVATTKPLTASGRAWSTTSVPTTSSSNGRIIGPAACTVRASRGCGAEPGTGARLSASNASSRNGRSISRSL